MRFERKYHVNHTLAGTLIACLVLPLMASIARGQGNVVTIGDSWAYLVAGNAPGSAPPAPGFANAMQEMLNAFHPGKTVYNESFAGGTAAQHAADLGGITARINAHPDADIVLLSSGGNDMLLGAAGGGFFLGNPNNPAVYANIANNVNTVVNHILSLRSDIQIVIQGYDYLNMWDGSLAGAAGDPTRLNYGMVRADTGNALLDLVLNVDQNAQLNQGFRDAEQGKIAIAAGNRRVHHVNNFGLNTALAGYSGALGFVPPAGAFPPDIAPDAPVTAALMNDPIHLNSAGYRNLALRSETEFFDTAFDPAVLAVSANTLDFGSTRIGTTSGQQSVTASNAGPNFTKVKDLVFGAASGQFDGTQQTANPLFQDPTLGSDSASNAYSFSPTARGADSQGVSLASNSGSPGLTLQGVGVGPEFEASLLSLDFGTQTLNSPALLALDVLNGTPDADLGTLTDLTLLSLTIIGPDADSFDISGFVPGTVLGKAELMSLVLSFEADTPGTKNATLAFLTDQQAALGQAGLSFQIPLSGVALVPEPSSLALFGIAAGLLALVRLRRRGTT